MQTILEILQKTTAYFEDKQVPKPKLDAEHLMAQALGCRRMDLYLQYGKPMTKAQLDTLRPWVRRRGQREPLQYILGHTPFVDADLLCKAGALIPRPETEEMVDRATRKWATLSDRPPQRIVDLGTGTGAIAISLALAFPEAQVVGADISREALDLARQNAERNGVSDRMEWVRSSWWDELEGEFDLVLSNPPYLTQKEVDATEPEVAEYEPIQALLGRDMDGAGDFREIISGALEHVGMASPFLIGLETGIAQHDTLTEFAHKAGWSSVESEKDLDRRPRYLWISS